MMSIAERYEGFAKVEAAGQSQIYQMLALHVARSRTAIEFLGRLPQDRQQPNLLFAAVRLIAGTPQSPEELDTALQEHSAAITDVMLSRTTQTNEPARCASLMPALSQIDGPIALIEVGASAGLCLLPDFYGYDWGRRRLQAPDSIREIAPVFRCEASENTPLSSSHPDIVWRAGLDLNPLDVANIGDVSWLETLVWPEHHGRLANLRSALQVAQVNPPRIIAGDLRNDLTALIDEAPSDATIVVFHTAVLSYVSDRESRDEFAQRMIDANVIWLSNEAPRVFPQFGDFSSPRRGLFLLASNGNPTAWTGPHGQSVDWIE